MIHEKRCLVILALESEVNPQKMSTFCLSAYDIDDMALEEPGDALEVIKITITDRVPNQIMRDAFNAMSTLLKANLKDQTPREPKEHLNLSVLKFCT